MTINEIADFLKTSKDTIYKMAQRGQIPGSKLGNQWRFNREIVDRWLKSHSNAATSENIISCTERAGESHG